MLLNCLKQSIRARIQLNSIGNIRTISSITPVTRINTKILKSDNALNLTPTNGALFQQIRGASGFFTKQRADTIWKSLLSVSNAGRRRGRGKMNRMMYKDLNRGQITGIGKKNFAWPGLTADIFENRRVAQHKPIEPDVAYEEKLLNLRSSHDKKTRTKVHPLERGWSGNKPLGKWIGPPDPIAGESFEGFDSKMLVLKPIFFMKPNFGRTKMMSTLIITGNKNGLIGYAVAKSNDMRTAIRNARNKAGQRLFNVELERKDDGVTVLHDFCSRFGYTTVTVEKKPPGYGLTGHRIVRAICSVLGITDIKVQVNGAERNYLNLTRAFLLGLINQKTFQQLANEKQLYVVEFNQNLENYPMIKARPESADIRTDKQIGENEVLDFDIYVHDGRVKEPEVLKPMSYTKHKGWRNYMKIWNYRKARERVRIDLIAKYGQVDSYLTIREKERLQAQRDEYLRNNPQSAEE